MPEVTEDTVNDLMASYLQENGLNVTTQVSARTTGRVRRRTKPDFELRDGSVLYGEGEWDSKYVDGFYQAIEFGDIGGASGYFLIGYPETLRKSIRQRRIGKVSPVSPDRGPFWVMDFSSALSLSPSGPSNASPS